MAKLTDFTTPTGAKGNLLDVKSIWNMILGTIVFLVVFATGQNLLNKVSGKVPMIDTNIEKPWSDPTPMKTSRKVII